MSSSVIHLRQYFKRNKVLNIIRSGTDVSRHDVKKKTMYSIATVADIISDLIDEGLVYEEDCQEARVGRRPTWLRLNPSGAFFVGVEFNAQMMYCAMLNLVGEVMWEASEPVRREDTSDEIIARIVYHVEQAMEKTPGSQGRVSGICVGVPGYVDKEKGLGSSYTHLKNWVDVPVRQKLEEHFRLPCYIDNNINVMALAYKWFYFSDDVTDYVLVSMRTGVRLVPFVNNEVILSRSGFSGELGHVHVAGGGRLCSCGRYGCLNSEVSNGAVLSTVHEGLGVGRFGPLLEMAGGEPEKITIELFCEAVNEGQEDAINLAKRVAMFMGEALGAVVNIFAPQVIVLTGNMPSALGEGFVSAIYHEMEPYTIRANHQNLRVSASAFDQNIGAIGAAAMVMQEEFEFIDQPI